MWANDEIVQHWNSLKYHDEKSIRIIAELNDVSTEKIKEILGITEVKSMKRWMQENIEEIGRLRQEGKSFREIGEKFGVKDYTVYNVWNYHIKKLNEASQSEAGTVAEAEEAKGLERAEEFGRAEEQETVVQEAGQGSEKTSVLEARIKELEEQLYKANADTMDAEDKYNRLNAMLNVIYLLIGQVCSQKEAFAVINLISELFILTEKDKEYDKDFGD